MWRLVSEGCRFYRSVILTSWAFGGGIYVVVVTALAAVGSVRDLAGLPKLVVQLPVAILIASMIAGFIITGTERGEARVRMHAMLPVSVRQVAVARVLVPAVPILLGLVVSHVVFGPLLALEGSSFASPRHLNLDFTAFQFILWVQIALAVRELIELRNAGRRGAVIAWTAALVFTVAAFLFIVARPFEGRFLKVAAVAALDVLVMAFTASRFSRRTVFTK